MKAYVTVGGGGLFPGVECPPLLHVNLYYVYRNKIRKKYFQYPLERISETSNNQAILNPFYHNIKMKEYMRVEGVDTLPWGRLPHTAFVQFQSFHLRQD